MFTRACGGEPFSEVGCDRYFCSKHKVMFCLNESTGKRCRHRNDCDCKLVEVCERCAKRKPPFPYKPETKEWIHHLLTDDSWAEWRKNNPDEVEELLK